MENWFYMSTEERTAADLKEAAADIAGIEIDLWREANILELTLKNGVIDFEPMKPYFKDKADNEYLESRQIKTLFAVTADRECEKEAEKIFAAIVQKAGGFFCGDSADFQPVIGKN